MRDAIDMYNTAGRWQEAHRVRELYPHKQATGTASGLGRRNLLRKKLNYNSHPTSCVLSVEILE